jgi:hypothetical protein
VKFYRIEHEDISQIAERFGAIQPDPDQLLAEALGPDYASRWQRALAARPPASATPVPAPVPVQAPATGGDSGAVSRPAPYEPVSGTVPRDGIGERLAELTAAAVPGSVADARHPGRLRMAAMLRSAGVRGMTVRAIADQLGADGPEVAHQTVHRWLTEEAAAGRAEHASYGRWKWRGSE